MRTQESAAHHSFDAQAEERFEAYVASLGAVVGNEARRRGLRDYVRGLLLPGQRKSMEPIAERLDPDNVSRRHQALHHFISEARWSDAAVLARVQASVLPALEECAPLEHLIIDDTPLHKSGRHSVGVAVQYSGRIRTTTNCQALVSLSVSNGQASLPVACQLYLPEDWASDHRRRFQAGVPAAVAFRTKHAMALEQLRAAKAAGLPGRIVLMDGAFGTDGRMRAGIRALDLEYAAAVACDVLAVAKPVRPLCPGALIGRRHTLVRHAWTFWRAPWGRRVGRRWLGGRKPTNSGAAGLRRCACARRRASSAASWVRRNGCSLKTPTRPTNAGSG